MKLVDQWRAVEATLPADWQEVRARLRPEDPAEIGEAARILGPMTVGRIGDALAFTVVRAGGAAGPQAARRLFAYLDEARVWCVLDTELASVQQGQTEPAEAQPVSAEVEPTLTEAWAASTATLPHDWSDLLAELEVDSSDNLDRAALLGAPLNPSRDGDRLAFTFRCASRAGYGVSPAMARRCFERCDAAGITGRVRVLRVLSDTDLVGTQGPSWIVGGKVL